MVGVKTKTQFKRDYLRKKKNEGVFEGLSHAAATLRKIAYRSIRPRKRPSAPGTPPHTQTKRLPRSLRYHVDRQREIAVVGTDATRLGKAGGAHEHGGLWHDRRLPARPFMAPALEKIQPRLGSFFKARIHE